MKTRVYRFLAYLRVNSRRWWGELTFRNCTIGLLVWLAIIGASYAPYMRVDGRSWRSFSSWRECSREGAILLVAGALFLRYEKQFIRALAKRKVDNVYQVRMSALAGLIDRAQKINLKRLNEMDKMRIDALRIDTLKCVTSGIADQLGLDPLTITANLLILEDGEPRRMSVVARSDNRRPFPRTYEATDDLLVWKAIRSGAIEIEDDLSVSEPKKKRHYRSIAAIPVTKGENAYGGLSIDCEKAYAFYGERERVYCQCRPYIALLALTFEETSPYYQCQLYPPHPG